MKLTFVLLLLINAIPSLALGGIVFGFGIIDTSNGTFIEGGGAGNPEAVSAILQHEVTDGHMRTIVSGGTITRTLDISNLLFAHAVIDAPLEVTYTRVTMADLAAWGGFDHFNFVQTISYLPASVHVSLLNLATGGTTSLPVPFYDPVIDSVSNAIVLHTATASSIIANKYVTDTHVAYYNDDVINDAYYGNWITDTSIKFTDSPTLSAAVLMPSIEGNYVGFTTSLVGVDENGDINTMWNGIGTQMMWNSNIVHGDSDFPGSIASPSYTATLSKDGLPATTSGEIYGVHYDGVTTTPEPATFIQVAFGLCGVLIWLFIVRMRK
ncbi:MAG: hypothetical protein JSS02_25160 [Planctomycetes bacterium]|nr:hypothetical protein [Planctomycetota bacterium]